MSEQTFRSPNYYEREIDLSAPQLGGPVGTPAAVVGTANKGPAFVPVTFANMSELEQKFGNLDTKKFGLYAANEFLKNRNSLSYLRVLGAGANTTDAHISETETSGRVNNAGFTVKGTAASHDALGRHNGAVQFLAARHDLRSAETIGMPMFTDNDSYTGSVVKLIRGMIALPTTARMMVLDGNESAVGKFTASGPDDFATLSSGKFKLVISSTLGDSFYKTDGSSGVRIYTASLNPTDADYFAKVLNSDPDRFVAEQHYLMADFAVDDEVATATSVATLSGSTYQSLNSGAPSLTMREAFGSFDTRYKTPATTWFISQPFGNVEYDLFKFESLDDGEYANNLYKISITNLKASVIDTDPYGTFTVQIRDWNDTDTNPRVLESFPNCSLNPNSDNYVAKLIGDRKVTFNFDTTLSDEKRLVTFGKYDNLSKYVRIVMNDQVERKIVPEKCLPFGFRGVEVLKTNDALNDTAGLNPRVVGVLGTGIGSSLSGSLVPPVPFRFKVTKGEAPTSPAWPGEPGATEIVNSQFYWGVKFERNTTPTNSNLSSEKNALLDSYTKFLGISKLDTLVTGSGADTLNNNKFTLANVAFSNGSVNDVTSSAPQHMKEAAYIRNAKLDPKNYTFNDGVLGNRITFATLLANAPAATFNNFVQFTKFTTFMYGGFDGVNVLDKNARNLTDRSTSFDAGGGAESSYVAPGMTTNPAGSGVDNNAVVSFMTAVDIMTDPMFVNHNVLAMPGVRESYVTDYAMKKVKDYGLAMYVMDVPAYDDNGARLYDDSTDKPNVEKTAQAVDTRGIDNNCVTTYFPDVVVDDLTNNRRVTVPASVAALGAFGFNDKVAYPWFAPAGFNRASLDFVKNVSVRLYSSDRDRLQDSRINPIATFPKLGFVIYGQKTMQAKQSALSGVNVRRMLFEVKRQIINIGNRLNFEQNTVENRNKFVSDANVKLSFIKGQFGIEKFKVIMNETNNTELDAQLNRLNGKIVVVPTKTFEIVAIDFIITNDGVAFI